MKKFLIPLAAAIAALLSQQGLAPSVSPSDKSSPSKFNFLSISPNSATTSLKFIPPAIPSSLLLFKTSADVVRTGHRSHSSHSSHRSHRSGR
jgi:hypothetical protein